MTALERPATRPQNPFFSSGPCAKRPGWSLDNLKNAILGRSHRSAAGKARLKLALDRTRALLKLPDDYLVAIVPGSDTGAVEMALWSLLGPRGVDVLAWEAFGKDWVVDVVKQLKLGDVRVMEAAYGQLPDLRRGRFLARCRLYLERNHIGRAGTERRLDRGGPAGPHHLRRDLRHFRAKPRLGEARCDHLFLAEGSRRRGGSRDAHPVSACRRATGEAIRRIGRCQRSSG